jgi:membrane protein
MRVPVIPTRLFLAAGAAASLVATRAVLPYLLIRGVRFALAKIPGHQGRLTGLELHLVRGILSLRQLAVARSPGQAANSLFEVERLTLKIDWKRLITGALLAELRLERPRARVDLATLRDRHAETQSEERAQPDGRRCWRQRARDLLDFRINLALTGGALELTNVPGLNGTALRADDIDGSIENLTNSARLSSTLLARVECRARVMTAGRLALRAQAYPFADQPTFDADMTLQGLDLAPLGPVIRQHAGFDVTQGTLEVYGEAAAKDGRLRGYLKPIVEHLEVERQDRGLAATVKQAGARVATRLFEHKKDGRIATRLEFDGSIDRPDIDILGAVGNFISSAYLSPLGAELEDRVRFRGQAQDADDAQVQYEALGKSRLRRGLELVVNSALRWSQDQVPRMAAALSYYTAFSMAPLLILLIAIAGLSFGRDAAEGRIMDEIGGLVGVESAMAIQGMIRSAQRPVHGILATIISVIGLLGGASGVVSELTYALSRIFRTQETGGWRELVKERLKLYGIVLGIGFVLTVSLAISAAVAAAGKLVGGLLPIPELVMHAANFLVSFAVTTALFGLMYKFLPDVRLRWRDVWLGAGITSLLFTIGKFLLGLYLGKGAVGSSYGAAGSVLIILLWVYYSALIFYFGAEFTKVYADRLGSTAEPEPAIQRAAPRATPGVR